MFRRRGRALLAQLAFAMRVALGLMALLIAAACEGVAPAPATSPSTSALLGVHPTAVTSPTVPPSLVAIDAVFASSAVRGDPFLRSFPRAGQTSCDIPMGGPISPADRVISGHCETTAAASGSGFIVSFTQRWEASRFHAQSDPASGELNASWLFDVDANGAVTVRGLAGNFPPQLMK